MLACGLHDLHTVPWFLQGWDQSQPITEVMEDLCCNNSLTVSTSGTDYDSGKTGIKCQMV